MKLKNFTMFLKITIILMVVGTAKTRGSEDVLRWQIIHWPPFMILEDGRLKSQGGGKYTKLMKYLQSKLPEYKHIERNMLWSRVWTNIKKGLHICNIMAYKNPQREKFTEFSVPLSIFLSNSIIMRKDKLKIFGYDNAKSISLNEISKRKDMEGLLETKRSYSAPIDNILLKIEKQSNIKRSPVNSKQSIKMLLIDKFDYIMEYPIVAAYEKTQIPEKGELIAISISEIRPVNWGYLACPKNDWGKKLIARVNEILLKEKDTSKYRNIIEMMGSNESEKQLIRDHYNEFLKAKY